MSATTSSAATGGISLRNVHICFGSGRERVDAVQDVSIDIAPGQFTCLLGPSGCGKSTLLSALAGFVEPVDGEVQVDGVPVVGPSADRGVVFQNHCLFPWKTVAKNVEFGLKMKGHPRGHRAALATDFLAKVGLSDVRGHYPSQLSGGMQQRVGIARALVNRPRVVLMDEPFGALDAQTRLMMQELLLNVWAELRTTVVFVTHDIDEAIFTADRVLVMSNRPGRIKADLTVNLPRPRTPEIITSPRFAELKRTCMELIRQESLKTMASQWSATQRQSSSAWAKSTI
jgi:NitT/TauT family transport system ATP-binding protein